MIEGGRTGVPNFLCAEYAPKTKDYVVLIPVINEGERILKSFIVHIDIILQTVQIL